MEFIAPPSRKNSGRMCVPRGDCQQHRQCWPAACRAGQPDVGDGRCCADEPGGGDVHRQQYQRTGRGFTATINWGDGPRRRGHGQRRRTVHSPWPAATPMRTRAAIPLTRDDHAHRGQCDAHADRHGDGGRGRRADAARRRRFNANPDQAFNGTVATFTDTDTANRRATSRPRSTGATARRRPAR